MLWTVIMAGGRGERFWPKSRERLPKQLLPITGRKSMVQLTFERLEGLAGVHEILVLTQSSQLPLLKQQLPLLPSENFIAEPAVRDTAACIGLAAIWIQYRDPEAVMVVLPADHCITPRESFQQALRSAARFATENPSLVTLGIPPLYPATGYGYLETGDALASAPGDALYRVTRFVEKPGKEQARSLLASGNYYWNSGIFIWRTQTILSEIERQMPELHAGLQGMLQAAEQKPWPKVLEAMYPALPKVSIDFGVMEGAREVAMCRAPFEWDDVGTWEALAKHHAPDADGNILVGLTRVKDCRNTIVYNWTENDTLLATAVGQDNQILIQTEDAVLLVPRGDPEKVKAMVAILKNEGLGRFL